MMTLADWYKSSLKQKIEKEMVRSFDLIEDAKIRNIVSKQIFPSKRIRSYFLFLLCDNQIDKNDFIKIAVAIELYHQATLIFDDIIDDDEMRDGDRIALHKYFGRSGSYADGVASHIASLLIILSDMHLLKLEHIDKEFILAMFNETKLAMFNSQLADTLTAEKPKSKKYMDWLINNSYRKTSNFIEIPFRICCLLNNIGRERSEEVISFGTNFGIIYQIGDDLFDIENGVKSSTLAMTYPFAFLLDNERIMQEQEKGILRDILDKKFLDKEMAHDLTLLFRKYKEEVSVGAYAEIEARKMMMARVPICDEIKGEMMKVLSFVKDSSYWKYQNLGENSSSKNI